jgi:trigger factor
MEIKETIIDDLNRKVTVEIERPDYEEQKTKRLKDFRRNADIKGFRKGMAPMSLIEHLRGGEALADSINEVVSGALDKYIQDNKLNVLGEPMPSEDQDKNDWQNPDKFSFTFDLGLAPTVDFEVSKEDKIPYYNIKIDDKAVAEQRDNMLRRFGKFEDAESATEDDHAVVDLEQEGRKVEKVYITISRIADKGQKDLFIGKKPGDSFEADLKKAFPDEAELADVLRVKKEEIAAIAPEWKVTVVTVKKFVKAEPSQEIYDQLFEKGTVTDEAGFDAKVRERLADEYKSEADFHFIADMRQYYIQKANLALPDAFLKRWIYNANKEKYSMEDIEKEFDGFAKDFRWQLVSGYLMKKYDLKVDKDEMLKQAKMLAAYQFAMYGLSNVPDDQLSAYAQNILSDKDQAQRISERVEEEAIAKYVMDNAGLDKKSISLDKFRGLK